MTEQDMDLFIETFNAETKARGMDTIALSISRKVASWRTEAFWAVNAFFMRHPSTDFEAATPEAACEAAWKWLNEYKPAAERLGEILGAKLVA